MQKNDNDLGVFEKLKELITAEYGKTQLFKYIHFKSSITGVSISTDIPNQTALNIHIDIEGDTAVINYSSGGYSNYSELSPEPKHKGSLAEDIFDIFNALAQNGAKRIDKFVGKKLVSSTLIIEGYENTQDIKSFRLFGRREKKEFEYPSLLSILSNK